jgi:hypothetical protein
VRGIVFIAVRKVDDLKLVLIPGTGHTYPYKGGVKFKEDTLLVVIKTHI